MSIVYQKIAGLLEWIEQTGDPRMTKMWLMGSIWPVLIILAVYLYFVLKIGPEFMKYRNPMNIDRIVMVYNVSQVLLSLFILERAVRLIWLKNDYRISCIEIDYSDTDLARKRIFGTWLYFFSKVLDLLDTIFFVLRKKQNQISFLHIYHHTMVLSFSWFVLRLYPGGQVVFFGTINSFVHVVMYSYYFLTILKPEYKKAWWKKHLTQLQLIQFVIVAIHGFIGFCSTNCSFPKYIIVLALPQDMIMFYLFWNFYKKTYMQPKNKLT